MNNLPPSQDQVLALLAEGATRHVFTNAAGKPARASADVVAVLERFRTTEGES